jgi:hypothetical protein
LMAEERQRLAEAVKHHQRDRNRAPSEPAGERGMAIARETILIVSRTPRSRKSKPTEQGGDAIRR